MNAVAEVQDVASPILFSDSAASKVAQLIEEEGNPDLKLRVFVQGGGCSGFQYGFTFDEIVNEDDTTMVKNGVATDLTGGRTLYAVPTNVGPLTMPTYKALFQQGIYDLGNGQWNIPELRRLLEEILPRNNSFEDFLVEFDFGRIGSKSMLLNARRLVQHSDGSRWILLAIEDVSGRTLRAGSAP